MSCIAAKFRPDLYPGTAPVPETILVVEDHEEVRRICAFALRLAGYIVLEATDGVKAMEVSEARDGPIHLLIADVRMPRVGGHDLAERLNAARPGIKVLFVSGNVESLEDDQEKSGTEAALLQKPFTPGSLIRRVKAILGQT
jgi:two-component system, cell cycle sensor histidine kinase and response regulator CckA